MVMDKINGFSNLSKGLLDKFQGSGRTDSKDRNISGETHPGSPERRTIPADKADISPTAHRLNALRNAVDSGLRALEALPEVRQERVDEARSRLDRGFYNSVQVRDRVAERIGAVSRQLEEL